MSNTATTELAPQTWTLIYTASADGILMIGNQNNSCIIVRTSANAPAQGAAGFILDALDNYPHPVSSGDKVWAWAGDDASVVCNFAAK